MSERNKVTIQVNTEVNGYEEISEQLNELIILIEKANSLINELANSELKITTVLDRH